MMTTQPLTLRAIAYHGSASERQVLYVNRGMYILAVHGRVAGNESKSALALTSKQARSLVWRWVRDARTPYDEVEDSAALHRAILKVTDDGKLEVAYTDQ